MARTNESALQRIQVGVIGLLAVLVFVYIANFLLERAPTLEQNSVSVGAPVNADEVKPKDEPLAELGVTPVVEDNAKAQAQPANPTTR